MNACRTAHGADDRLRVVSSGFSLTMEIHMRTYLATTGALFALLVVAHVWRMALEPNLARDPWFLIFSVLAAGLSIWAFSLLRRAPRPASDSRS
jgi:hypothetical protein